MTVTGEVPGRDSTGGPSDQIGRTLVAEQNRRGIGLEDRTDPFEQFGE